jgi:hypothetical protein
MLTLHDNNIILGSIGGGGVAPPANGWLAPPVMTETTMNGLTDACGLFCNVLDIGDRNYFSCLAADAYTVSVYTAVGGTLISSQNVAADVQCNWQIEWDACTHNIDADTRQAYVEITPQSGQSLTLLRFNTNHPAETNANSTPYIASMFQRLPNMLTANLMYNNNYLLTSATHGNYPLLTNATSMHNNNFGLASVTHGNYPLLTNATTMHGNNSALTSATHGNYPLLTNATSMHNSNFALQYAYFGDLSAVNVVSGMFGSTEIYSCRSLRKLITNGLGTSFANAATFVLRFTALQAEEALEWVDSLGTSTSTITFDLRNNPFSTSTLVAPAILAKFPNAVVQLV